MKLLSATVLALSMAFTTSHADLKVGDDAPEFELKGSDGKTYKSSELKGKQAYVIAWFPKVFTGG
jgi:peroxiredoxin Q/BCP